MYNVYYTYIINICTLLKVVEHGEKSLDIDFGDSDDEEGEVPREERGERNGRRSSGTVSGGIIAELTDAIEEEEEGGAKQVKSAVGGGGRKRSEDLDDNGFCLLDAPTSTYVVRYVFLPTPHR